MFKKASLLAASTVLLISSNAFAAATQAGAEKAIEKASMAQAAAKKLGYEWRDTGKMIKAAKKMISQKKYSAAINTANKAEQQGHSAVAQYHIEAKRYTKNH